MHSSTFIWLALALMVLWLVLKVALAITSVLLHLLWIAAIIFVVLWIFGQLTGKRAT
ncbi:hypothetical protein DES53_101102 [Roseimicrobium gellanilyticum]|uniref:Hydrophobic protein n=1 Tax=Roseimicrobium gellanilyticum TaxID=748857 RepID=A0A366HUY0_9BACT|nr:hypothetical protein [Roseimicrobium gellanilyticum]RBP47305.1 hypothetical protein DES53_101102 [Roseimicrobium gellanilyticum]